MTPTGTDRASRAGRAGCRLHGSTDREWGWARAWARTQGRGEGGQHAAGTHTGETVTGGSPGGSARSLASPPLRGGRGAEGLSGQAPTPALEVHLLPHCRRPCQPGHHEVTLGIQSPPGGFRSHLWQRPNRGGDFNTVLSTAPGAQPGWTPSRPLLGAAAGGPTQLRRMPGQAQASLCLLSPSPQPEPRPGEAASEAGVPPCLAILGRSDAEATDPFCKVGPEPTPSGHWPSCSEQTPVHGALQPGLSACGQSRLMVCVQAQNPLAVCRVPRCPEATGKGPFLWSGRN